MALAQIVRLAKSVLARVAHHRRQSAKNRKFLYGQWIVVLDDPDERAFQQRKLLGYLRMRVAGTRPASIRRYLRKGWPSFWTRACLKEMAALVDDIKLNSALDR